MIKQYYHFFEKQVIIAMTSSKEQQTVPLNYAPIVFYKTENGQTVLDVQLRDETVWLNQAQMTELFQRNKYTVSEHIRYVFKEGELVEDAVVRNFRTTAYEVEK